MMRCAPQVTLRSDHLFANTGTTRAENPHTHTLIQRNMRRLLYMQGHSLSQRDSFIEEGKEREQNVDQHTNCIQTRTLKH